MVGGTWIKLGIFSVSRSVQRRDTEMTFSDEIWQHIKKDANKWADSERPMPSADDCLEHIRQLLETTMPRYSWISAEARAFYANEFVSMIAIRRAQRTGRG